MGEKISAEVDEEHLIPDAEQVLRDCRIREPEQSDADGWIPWSGGECPIEGETIVQIRMRDGCETEVRAILLRWDHYGFDNDIIAYRIVKPEQPSEKRHLSIAPWSPEQIARLDARQERDNSHPYTCPRCSHSLEAFPDGWYCENQCGYTQNWCLAADVESLPKKPSERECSTCKGRGRIPDWYTSPRNGAARGAGIYCRVCKGTGRVRSEGEIER